MTPFKAIAYYALGQYYYEKLKRSAACMTRARGILENRQRPLAEMAVRVKEQMERDPAYRISGKQIFTMDSTEELKVPGIKLAKIALNTSVKEEIWHQIQLGDNKHD